MVTATWKKRALSLLCSAAMMASLFTGARVLNTFAEGESVSEPPAMPDTAIAVLGEKSGVTDGLGGGFGWSADRLMKEGFDAVDATRGCFIELDVFISDLQLAKDNGMGTIWFGISSGDSRWADRTRYAITDQITRSGWNHVKIHLNDPHTDGDGVADPKALKNYMMFIEGGETGTAKDVQISIQNVCVTNWVPGGAIELSKDGCSTTTPKDLYGQGTFDTAKDLSKADYLEFDIKVVHYTELLAAGGQQFWFGGNQGSVWGKRTAYRFTDYLTGEGWNHVKMPIGNSYVPGGEEACNLAEVYAWAFFSEVSSAPAGAALYVKNFYATTDTLPDPADSIPEKPEDVKAAADDANCLDWTMGNEFSAHSVYAFNKNGFTPLDATQGTHIEFDFYVGDYKTAKAAGMGAVMFGLSSGDNWGQSRSVIQIEDQIVKSGWNHVKFAYADMQDRDGGRADFTGLKNFMFEIKGGAAGAAKGMKFAFANLCVTDHAEKPDDAAGTLQQVPALPNDVVEVLNQAVVSDTVGKEFGWINDRIFKEDFPAVDFKKATYVEFDLYIGNLEKLRSAGMNQLRFGVSSALKKKDDADTAGVENPRYFERAHYNILNQVTQSGWNHIRLAWDTDSSRQNDNGSVNFAAIRNAALIMGGASANGAVEHVPVAMANVCITVPNTDAAYPPPAMQPNPVVILDSDGFSNSNLKDLIYQKDLTASPVNLSGAEYLEFDVFVEDHASIIANSVQGFSLSSGDNKWDYRAHYLYTDYLYGDGWNHVRIPVEGMTRYENGNETDMSAVTYLLFYSQGAAPGRLVMANFCATNPSLTEDREAPSFENTIVPQRQEEKGITIGWNAARDNVSMKPEITYTAYYSKEPITAENLGQAVKFTESPNILSATARGLEKLTGYYFAVTAADAAGNKTTVYTTEPIRTAEKTDTYSLFEGVASEAERGALDVSGEFPAFSKEFIRDTNATSGWYNNIIVQHSKAADFRDISSYNSLSVDVYIGDLARYESIWKPHMYIVLKSGAMGEEDYQAETFPLKGYDLKEGWNTLVIDLSGSHVDLRRVSSVMLATFPLDDTNLGYYPSEEEADCNTVFKIANILAADIENPAYSMTEMENGQFLLSGGSYVFMNGYGTDHPKMKVWQKTAAPVDISGADFVEFDFYVEDWEALKGLEGFSGLKLRLLSSEDEFLPAWRLDFTDQVTASGWTHIKLDLTKGMPEGEYDATQFMGARLFAEGTAAKTAQDIKIAFKNLYATAKTVIEYPKDPDRPARPDKDALYISDCEGLAVDGTWNPAGIWLDTDNKTEGKASVGHIFKDQAIRSNSMRFILSRALDLTGSKTLKFDLWISDPELLRQRASMSVRLTSDRRGYEDYFNWKLDLSGLKFGWNAVEIDLTEDFAVDGRPDWSAVKVFHLLCDEAAFVEANEEEVIVKLDNIRVTGAAGGGNRGDHGGASTGETNPLLPVAMTGLGISGLGVVLARKKRIRR